MISKHEAERIAAAVHSLRPEWPLQQVMTLCRELMSWSALDLGVGLAYVALDPASKSPYRVKEQGPWRTVGMSAPSDEAARERAKRDREERLAQIGIRTRAIAACHICDDNGYLNGRVCSHSDQTAQAHRGAQLARANIRPTITAQDRITEEA